MRNHLEEQGKPESKEELADLCASVQEAIVDALVGKTIKAAIEAGRKTIVLAGGVAANKRLREKMTEACEARGFTCVRTPMPYCTDNAAMIAGLGVQLMKEQNQEFNDLSLDAYANLRVGSPRTHRTGVRMV